VGCLLVPAAGADVQPFSHGLPQTRYSLAGIPAKPPCSAAALVVACLPLPIRTSFRCEIRLIIIASFGPGSSLLVKGQNRLHHIVRAVFLRSRGAALHCQVQQP